MQRFRRRRFARKWLASRPGRDMFGSTDTGAGAEMRTFGSRDRICGRRMRVLCGLRLAGKLEEGGTIFMKAVGDSNQPALGSAM